MTYTVHCQWLPANNFLFQIANVWLVLSYLCPPTLNGLIYLRLCLGLAGIFFALWGWLVLCAPDTFIWNLFFFVGNFVHLAYIFYSRRSKKFHNDMEIIYEKLFRAIEMPRHQFQYLANVEDFEINVLSPGEVWAIDGVTQLKSLSVLLEGNISCNVVKVGNKPRGKFLLAAFYSRWKFVNFQAENDMGSCDILDVRKHGQVVHTIQDFQFLNSPEWIMSQDIPYIFEVTMQAKTECKVISWDRIKLLNILKKNAYLRTVLDSVVSRDIAQKLFAMNRRIQKSGQGLAHSIYSLNEIGQKSNDDVDVHVTMCTDIASESSDQENASLDAKTSLLSNGFNQCDRETRL